MSFAFCHGLVSAAQFVAPAPAAAQEFAEARLEVVGFDEAAVLAALRLRLPRMVIARHGEGGAPASPHIYVQIVRATGEGGEPPAHEGGELRLITSDGRAYERRFAVEVGQEVRVVASTAASLIFAVEQGELAPDREDVEIPQEPTGAGAPEEAGPEGPREPPAAPATAAGAGAPQSPVREDRPRLSAPPWEVGPTGYGAALMGLASRYAAPLTGAGGALGLVARAPLGVMTSLEVRGLGRASGGYALGRVRVGVGVGYGVRRGRFEMPIMVMITVEPWWAARGRGQAPLFEGTSEAPSRPLLGGSIVVSPGLRLGTSRGRVYGVRVGPRVELGGSFVVDRGARAVGLVDPSGVRRFGLGGVELSLGLEVAVAFSVGRGSHEAGK